MHQRIKALLFACLIFVAASPAIASSYQKGTVLVVVSAANAIPLREGTLHKTGIFLGELTEAADAMLAAGYKLVFASPGGKAPTIDLDSLRLIYWRGSEAKLARAKAAYKTLLANGLKHPLALEDLARDFTKLGEFDALFVPGGHGPLVDLMYKNMLTSKDANSDMGRILYYFHATKKPTGLLCHAPATLVTAPVINGHWIYEGYKVTAISRTTEFVNEDVPGLRVIDGHVGEYPSEILKNAGANYVFEKIPFIPFVVEDRELLTGQDPFAAGLMGKRFVEKLNREVK
jgi:putative intracellular protease/amidase